MRERVSKLISKINNLLSVRHVGKVELSSTSTYVNAVGNFMRRRLRRKPHEVNCEVK